MNTKQIPTLFQTDYYQISMVYAYVMCDIANETTGFEGFYRHIKPEVNSSGDFYIFSGENDVINFINQLKEDFKTIDIAEWFSVMLEGRVSDENLAEFVIKAKKLCFDFEYSVAPEGSFIKPQMPVFQFKGPRWIGQMIETGGTNSYNGKTGFQTLEYLKNKGLSDISSIDLNYIESAVFGFGSEFQERYIADLKFRAAEFKSAAGDIPLAEAAFRRAPSKAIADIASRIALRAGWAFTSNTSLWTDYQKYISGTMAHAFVMSFDTEEEAFRAWFRVFGRSTILIDTYDTINAVKLLIKLNLKPLAVRIDSGDFFVITQQVRDILDAAGWDDVKIFLSGDITPELLIAFERKSVPVDAAMAGTKYVYNNSIIKRANCGFVYKIVEYERNNQTIYPLKKAEGKKNYPSIKTVSFDGTSFQFSALVGNLEKNNLSIYSTVKPDSTVNFSF